MPTKEKLAKETPEQREKRLEYGRNYNKVNSEQINKRNSEYQKNNNNWKSYRTVKFICDCGSSTDIRCKYNHIKSAKHLRGIISNQASVIMI